MDQDAGTSLAIVVSPEVPSSAALSTFGPVTSAATSPEFPTTVVWVAIVIVFLAGLGLCAIAYVLFNRTFSAALETRTKLKPWIAACIAVAIPVGAILVEVAGFSQVRDGATAEDLAWVLLATLGVSVAVGAEIIWTRLGQKVDERVTKLEGEKRSLEKKLEDKSVKYRALSRYCKFERGEKDFVKAVSDVFLKVVSGKRDAIVKLLRHHQGTEITLADLRERVDPNERIVALIQTAFGIFEKWVSKTPGAELRLAYFREQGGYLQVVHCIDRHGNTSCVCGSSSEHRERFCLKRGQLGESLAVEAATTHSMQFASDAMIANLDPTHRFQHFDSIQPGVIKSIVCVPFGRTKRISQHVFCLDSNVPNLFRPALRERIEFVFRQLEQRLLFECEMDSLLPKNEDINPNKNGASAPHPKPNPPHNASTSKQVKAQPDHD